MSNTYTYDTFSSQPSSQSSSGPHESEPATQTSRCSLRNFHWARWWVVFPDYLQNHIQRCDWRGARPHLELIAADATQHKEMGCRGGVDGVGWGLF